MGAASPKYRNADANARAAVHEYEDRGVCGKKARRPGLDALMADARRKKFSVVLVAAFDRIARSTRNFLQIVDELGQSGY